MSSPLLKDFAFAISFPIAWAEMDYFQHVNNIFYLRYFENARIAYFEKCGLMDLMRTQGIGPILAETTCRFRKPLTYPDTIHVGARIARYNPERFEHEYTLVSEKLGQIAAYGSGIIVAYDYRRLQKSAFPDSQKAAMEALEGRRFAPFNA